jgi:hypothetical protein
MTSVGEVGQKCRDPETSDFPAVVTGFLTLLCNLTAAFQVSTLGAETWIYIMKIYWASLVDHLAGRAMETKIMKTNRASSVDHGGRPHCPHDIFTLRYPNFSGYAYLTHCDKECGGIISQGGRRNHCTLIEDPIVFTIWTKREKCRTPSRKGGKRAQWQLATATDKEHNPSTKKIGNSPNRASAVTKPSPKGKR